MDNRKPDMMLGWEPLQSIKICGHPISHPCRNTTEDLDAFFYYFDGAPPYVWMAKAQNRRMPETEARPCCACMVQDGGQGVSRCNAIVETIAASIGKPSWRVLSATPETETSNLLDPFDFKFEILTTNFQDFNWSRSSNSNVPTWIQKRWDD